ELGPAAVLLAEQGVLGNLDVGVEDRVGLAAAEGVDRGDLHALGLAGDEEHREALVLGVALGGAAHGEHVVGDAGVGDEDLLAVDDVADFGLLGLGRHRADVGAGLGLGHRYRLGRAGGDAAEDLLLLLLGAEALGGAGDDQGGGVGADRGGAAP